MTLAACSSAFDGMQPTLRQTPPSVCQRRPARPCAEIGGAEGGGVAAGPCAEHEHLGIEIALRGTGGWARGGAAAGACGGAAAALAGLERQDQVALGNPVAELDLQLGDGAGGRRRDVHAGLVALERDQRVVGLDRRTRRRAPRSPATSLKSPMSGTRTSIVS